MPSNFVTRCVLEDRKCFLLEKYYLCMHFWQNFCFFPFRSCFRFLLKNPNLMSKKAFPRNIISLCAFYSNFLPFSNFWKFRIFSKRKLLLKTLLWYVTYLGNLMIHSHSTANMLYLSYGKFSGSRAIVQLVSECKKYTLWVHDSPSIY